MVPNPTDPASPSVSASKDFTCCNARRNNEKALNILLSAIPDRHLLSFHDAVDARSLWKAIKARFGGNEASKKMQKNLLKQQFETFTIGSREELDSAYERFQHILSMLELHDATVSIEDANLKFLRSLPSVWHVVATMIRGQPGLDELDFDDLYNNLKVYEHELKGVSNSNSQNIAFLSTEVKGSTLKQSTAEPAHIPKGYTQAISSRCQLLPTDGTLTGVEQDDWSIEFDAEHMHFGQDGLGDFDWSNKADDAPISLALMATNSEVTKKSKTVSPESRTKGLGKLRGAARSRVPQAVRSRSTDGSYYPRLDSRRPRISSYSPSSRASQQKFSGLCYPLTVGCSGSMTGDKGRLSDLKGVQRWLDKECLSYLQNSKFVDGRFGILKLPRKNDVLQLDRKNIIPSVWEHLFGCKATEDEAVLWHRRLGHIRSKQHRVQESTMNEFCARKEQERYSIARDPQQKGCCRKERIGSYEAARTMLADSLLPIQFWAEAVNTALLCFDGKSEEGYLLGYSTNSKGFRVYNRVTRKVQDCLHVNFLENQENPKGKVLIGCFDLDLLTPSMNYILLKKRKLDDSNEQGISLLYMMTCTFELHQNLCKDNNDDQRIAFEEEKRRISIEMGKEHVAKKVLDYDEVFAPVDLDIEAIRLFWHLQSFMGFTVYSDGCQSAFGTGNITREYLSNRLQVFAGCLMYLTASRQTHMFAVCLCARFQGHSKDSPFHLEAFSDSDYAGDNHDRRSTSGGCQYLGRRLVLWMQNQLLDYGFNFMNTEIHIDNESTICIVKNPVFHSKTKHIQIRHHFIRDCYEQRLINVVKVHTDDNVADLLTKGFDLARFKFLVHNMIACVEKTAESSDDDFWKDQEEWEIIRWRFHESSGVHTLELEDGKKMVMILKHYLGHAQRYWLRGPKSTSWEQFGTNIASALVGLATNQKFNFSLMILNGMLGHISNGTPFLMYPRFVQLFLNKQLEGVDRPQDFIPSVSLPSKVFTFMRKHSTKFSCRITPLTPSMLEVVTALAAEEEHSTSPHSRAASSARDAQGSPTQSAAHSQRTASVQGTAEIQRTADFQGTAEPHDAASIPKSPNDYTPTDASQTSGGDEGLLDIYALNREVRRLKKQTLSQAKQILRLKAKLKKLSKFVAPVVKHHAFWVENQNLKKQKRRRKKHKKKVSSSKWGRNKITNLYCHKDKGKAILVDRTLKEENDSSNQSEIGNTQCMRRLLGKIQAEWDAEEERKRFEELKKTKPKTTLRKPTSLAQERNQMMSFLKGQGYKNLQKLKYPQMKELYDKVQASIKDSFKDFVPMDSEKEREMLKERDAKRLSRKRKATIAEEQPSKKPKLRTETIDELRNYLRIVDFEKNAQDRESLEGISMITELQVIDSPDGENLYHQYRSVMTIIEQILQRLSMGNIDGGFIDSSGVNYTRVRRWHYDFTLLLKEDIPFKRSDDKDARSWHGRFTAFTASIVASEEETLLLLLTASLVPEREKSSIIRVVIELQGDSPQNQSQDVAVTSFRDGLS
ncbi:hypothetical protein Tco_0926342 [Tanacetum coccineum]|uniref:Retroviral polymerase SH3-like domain-containing protein n=1 Tax=Tanacetum coccineum TaxID=301880 RepID=A0ABQ5DCB6_9ASTR